MAWRMLHLWKHPQSGTFYFRRAVPEEQRPAVGKREIKFTLGTKDLKEARLRYPDAAARANEILQRAAGGQRHLSHREVLALAGEWYRRELMRREDEPGRAEDLEAGAWALEDLFERSLTEAYRRYEYQRSQGVQCEEPRRKFKSKKFLPAVKRDVDELLRAEGLSLDTDSYERLAEHIFYNEIRLLHALMNRAGGDYSPDAWLDKIPRWQSPAEQVGAVPAGKGPNAGPRRGTPWSSLLDAWAAEPGRRERTIYEWRRVIGRLAKHLGHDDAERVSKADLIAWKDALVASGKGAKTVKNHIDVVRALYNSALVNERLQRKDNPAEGIRVGGRQDRAERRLPFTDEEAALILQAARGEEGVKRWVPWLLAFTGARLDEVCQAYTSDIRQDQGTWYLDINQERGKKLKNPGSARRVPLHQAILREGFLKYVKSLHEGRLFPDLKPDRFGSPGGTATKQLGRWIRSLGITDRRKVPNHSWRHRFKDLCRDAGIEKAMTEALMGHASRDVGDRYGSGYSLKTLAQVIEKIPVPPLGPVASTPKVEVSGVAAE
jgi:integrase